MLNGIKLRTVGRLSNEANILRNDELFGTMLSCLIQLNPKKIL